tara:strand:+ start:173 stop:454 length:282 start_codon:yes stop_codon:yes gene_type:complete
MAFRLGNNLAFTYSAAHDNSFSINRNISINSSQKEKNYIDSSSYLERKKATTIGLNRTNNTNYSDGGNKNTIKSTLGKVRNQGTVAPKKSIYR